MKTNGSPVLPESANDYSGASKGVEVGEDGQIMVKQQSAEKIMEAEMEMIKSVQPMYRRSRYRRRGAMTQNVGSGIERQRLS